MSVFMFLLARKVKSVGYRPLVVGQIITVTANRFNIN